MREVRGKQWAEKGFEGCWVRHTQSVLMDRFLHSLILYFVSFFQLYTLQRLKKVRGRLGWKEKGEEGGGMRVGAWECGTAGPRASHPPSACAAHGHTSHRQHTL